MSVPSDRSDLSDFSYLWTIAEESAVEHDQTVRREDWRLVVPVHLAESRKEAISDSRLGGGRWLREYSEETIGRHFNIDGPVEKIMDAMVESGSWIVGTPDDCIDVIKRLDERSGGFGGLLVMAQEWAPREKVLHSYELLARYVMPRFQGSLAGVTMSNQWTRDHNKELETQREGSIDRARTAWAERK